MPSLPSHLSDDQIGAVLYDALSSRKLELTLFPTEQCNFRCVYCYEDFSIGRMKTPTITGIKNLIKNRADDLDKLVLAWFGGEPLIAYDIVKEISAFASEVAADKGFATDIAITTNGYALDQRRQVELFASGVRKYQISLDGNETEHNRTRLRANGQGSFAKIWANLLSFNALCDQGAILDSSVMIRVHVHPNNIESVLELIQKIKDTLSPEFFTIFIKDVGYYGGKNDGTFNILGTGEDALAVKRKIYAQLPPFVRETHGEGLSVCYAAKANAFTVRADGSVGKCTVALNSSRNRVGWLKENGDLELDGEKAALWLHPLATMNLDDLNCPVNSLPQLATPIQALAAA